MSIKSAEKVLKVLKAMKGRSLKGISNKELAKNLEETESQISRALQTLVNLGFAQKLENGEYVLGNTMIQMAMAHSEEISRAQHSISEHCQRIAAGVNQIKGA